MTPAAMDFQRQIALELALRFRAELHSHGKREEEDVLKTAEDFYNFLVPPTVPVSVRIIFDAPTDINPNGASTVTALTDGQQIVAHVSELDSRGNAADQPGTWTVDRTDLLDVAVSDDGLSATFTAKGGTGSAVVSLTVGSLPTATAAVDIVPGDAASVEISFDDPTDQAAAPAPSQG